jgi:MarR family transcriptional regulator for hemolysin
MLEYDFQSSVGHSICMTAHLFERAINQELAPEGITFRQTQVLAWQALEGTALSQSELAERMNIEPPTLVSVLDRMERDGLLVREACPNDRRKNLIRVLPKAETVWKTIVACAERVRERAVSEMTAEDVETLHRLLGQVQANLQRKGPSQ